MGDGLKAAKSASTGPTAAQLRTLREAAARGDGRIFCGGSGRQQMLQRMARAGWGRMDRGIFEINDAGRRVAKEGGV